MLTDGATKSGVVCLDAKGKKKTDKKQIINRRCKKNEAIKGDKSRNPRDRGKRKTLKGGQRVTQQTEYRKDRVCRDCCGVHRQNVKPPGPRDEQIEGGGEE